MFSTKNEWKRKVKKRYPMIRERAVLIEGNVIQEQIFPFTNKNINVNDDNSTSNFT